MQEQERLDLSIRRRVNIRGKEIVGMPQLRSKEEGLRNGESL